VPKTRLVHILLQLLFEKKWSRSTSKNVGSQRKVARDKSLAAGRSPIARSGKRAEAKMPSANDRERTGKVFVAHEGDRG